MDAYTPPQVRGPWIASNTPAQSRLSPWNKPTDPLNSPSPSYTLRYPSTTAMPQTPSKAPSWRVVGSPTASAEALASPRGSPEAPAAPSVKHLTCYFWKAHGKCKHSDEDCLYAHHLTGQIADPPVQVEPGRPAVAGRNAMTARPVYENWRDQHGNPGVGPNMSTMMHGPIHSLSENFHNMAGAQNVQPDGQPQEIRDHSANGQRERLSFPPNFVHQPANNHPHAQSFPLSTSYQNMAGNLCSLVGDLYSVVDKSHDTFAQAVVTLHAQCEALLKQAQTLYRDADPKPKASIETLVSAVSAMMPLIDQQKRMAAETEDAKRSMVEKMERDGLGHMVRSWQSRPSTSSVPSASSGTQ